MSAQHSDAADLARARREANAAKAQLQSTVGALKQRLSPSTLATQAREKVRETTQAVASKASDAVKSRPTTVKAVAGAAVLLVFRKSLGRLAKAMLGREARQRRATRRAEKRAQKEAGRTGSELPPANLIPPAPDAPPAPKTPQE